MDESRRLRLWKRIRAGLLHLALSAVLATVIVLLISRLWYPDELFALARGRDIFFLLLTVDIVLGPTLTLVVFDVRKRWRELGRDLAVIGALQLGAMIYGLSVVLGGRPAYVVYNAGQFNVVLADELSPGAASSRVPVPASSTASVVTPDAPWWGPQLVGARLPQGNDERNDILFSSAAGGADVFEMPRYFVPYDEVRAEVARRSRTVAELARELRRSERIVSEAARRVGGDGKDVGLLPVVVRRTTAIAAVRRTDGQLLGIAALAEGS